jgi:hypothetical protein
MNKNDTVLRGAKVITGIACILYFYIPTTLFLLERKGFITHSVLAPFDNKIFSILMDWFSKIYDKHQMFEDFKLFFELFFFFLLCWVILFYAIKIIYAVVTGFKK